MTSYNKFEPETSGAYMSVQRTSRFFMQARRVKIKVELVITLCNSSQMGHTKHVYMRTQRKFNIVKKTKVVKSGDARDETMQYIYFVV